MSREEYRQFDSDDWRRILGCSDNESIPESCLAAIAEYDFSYQLLEGAEHEAMVLKTLKSILDEAPKQSGAHRLSHWEAGWSENRDEFIAANYSQKALMPKYIRSNQPMRMGNCYIQPKNGDFEPAFVKTLRNYIFDRYLGDITKLYEFGCGTGINLIHFCERFPSIPAVGLDWTEASQDILQLLQEQHGYQLTGRRFDFFSPDANLELTPGSGVLTIGALEQTGTDWRAFLEWLVEQPLKRCVHLEPMYEHYNQNNLVDYLGALHHQKRNYLSGYLTALKDLEKRQSIAIIRIHKTIGSSMHNGYNYVVWEKQ